MVSHPLRHPQLLHIAYATLRLSQFNTRPTEGSKAALLRVLGYLKGTTDFSICGRFSSQPDKVRIYSDSDHGGLRFVDGRSQSGLIVLLNDVPVYWRSNKQVSVSTSTVALVLRSMLFLMLLNMGASTNGGVRSLVCISQIP